MFSLAVKSKLRDIRSTPKPPVGRKPRTPRVRHGESGVVLILELVVALTILLIGIAGGILLLGSSQDLAGGAARDTEVTLFADSVLNGLRAASEEACRTNAWHSFWTDLMDGGAHIAVPAYPMWANEESLRVTAGATNALAFHAYWHRAADEAQPSALPVYGLRYALTVGPDPIDETDRSTFALLRVWPGTSGPSGDGDALTFYSEFFRQAVVP